MRSASLNQFSRRSNRHSSGQSNRQSNRGFNFRNVFPSSFMTAALLSFVLSACTNGQGVESGAQNPMQSPMQKSTSGQLANTQVNKVQDDPGTAAASARPCLSDDLVSFSRVNVEPIDLSSTTMPKGLYLATLSEVLVEKVAEDGQIEARFLAREFPGVKKGQVVCTESMDQFGEEFDMTLTGLAKFEFAKNPKGENLVARQFSIFANMTSHGIVVSNIDSAQDSEGLANFLSTGNALGEIIRQDEGSYALRFKRQQHNVRASLIVHFELIPN